MSVFNTTPNDAMKEPMFFGNPVNIARYDQQKFKVFESLIEKQLSFFWRPEEIDVSRDAIDFKKLPEHEQHIFISNLKYQTLLDSIQGRSPNLALLPIVSLPELETWIETWSFSETVHSRSYTHILRGIFDNPSEILDSIVTNDEIQKRAAPIASYYDDLIECVQEYEVSKRCGESSVKWLREIKKKLYLCVCSINALEAIRFYVSFACSFAFAERDLMEGNAKIIKLIARDEALHLNATQHILNLWADGKDDPDMQEIAMECFEAGKEIFLQAAEQEKEWARYLFKDGSMIGLNEEILCQYVEYITNQRMVAIGYLPPFKIKDNPIPWINFWFNSDNVQVAPQETEISSYLVGQINSTINQVELSEFELGD
jgi:ribonucleoside-diphosphate reductase beta chain